MIKVLIVDDSRINQLYAKDALIKNHIQCDIDLCSSGEEAIECILQTRYDLVLMDIIMPGLSGVEVLEKISTMTFDHLPKFIMLTNVSDINILKQCFEFGASDYIHKPFEEIEFISRLNSIIREIENDREDKKKAALIEQQYQELIKVNQSLKDAQYFLLQKEKLMAIGELAAGIAHEINNPLAYVMSNYDTIKAYSEDLKSLMELLRETMSREGEALKKNKEEIVSFWRTRDMDFVLEDFPEVIKDSRKGLEKVAIIVKSMREFARTTEDEVFEKVDMETLIDETLIIVANELKYIANIEKEIYFDQMVYCNKGQIEQVLVNLLVNAGQAIKMCPDERKGEIHIKASEVNGICQIEISDNGIGIEKVKLHRIFEPFYTSKPVGQGTGLGLSISYDIIVNKHKGNIEARSEVGEGTTFIVQLPIVNDDLS